MDATGQSSPSIDGYDPIAVSIDREPRFEPSRRVNWGFRKLTYAGFPFRRQSKSSPAGLTDSHINR